MLIERFVSGPVETNAYLVGDEASGEALVIDAPWECTAAVQAAAAAHGLTIRQIVDTHGHWDHIADNAALVAATGAPLAVHAADADRLADPQSRLLQLPFTIPPSTPDRLLAAGDTVTLGPYTFEVIHTPGHTPGSICLYEDAQGVLFSGDTLFDQGMGRTDLPGGDELQLYTSLKHLANLPPDTQVFPGHGADTTIGDQPWLLRLGWESDDE
jgi:glyoxylase-like metal-dependent hydrolase (beta-lactamase superfamily II)